MNNEDAINDPRNRNRQNEDRQQEQGSTLDPIKNRLKKKAGQKAAQFLVRQGISAIARTAATAASNPYIALIIGIVIFLIIFFVIMFGGGGGANIGAPQPTPTPSDGSQQPPIEGFTLTLTGPESIENGSLIGYTINYAYNESVARVPLDSITIYNDLPSNTTLEQASLPYSESGNTVSWSLENEPNQGQKNITLRPTSNDIVVINKAYARTSAVPDLGDGENVPPNNNNCDGAYSLNNPLGNFGDPNCNFTKDSLYTLLQSLDPQNADFWYYKIVPCESTYVPLAHNPNAVDPAGAWGLFQMGRGRNGEYDHGDVNWQRQVSNAINYNGRINGSFAYWECAR